MRMRTDVESRPSVTAAVSVPYDHQGWVAVAAHFAATEAAPIADEIDRSGRFPRRTVRRMGELGFMGLMVPRKHGGTYVSHFTYYEVLRLIARECVSHAMTLLSHSLCCKTIGLFGSREQRRRYLPTMARGEILGAVAMTEPGAGSDLAGVSTQAVGGSAGYTITGRKHFITNGGVAGVIVTLAAIAGREPPFHTSLFILEAGMDGLIIGKKENKLGFRASDTRELFFDGIELDQDRFLGVDGKGILEMQEAMESSKTAFSAIALGVAEAAFGTVAREMKKQQLSSDMSSVQARRMTIAEMDTDLECCRLMIRSTADRQDRGERCPKNAAMCKLQSSEMAQRITSRAVNMMGCAGLGRDYSVERNLRDARLFSIAEGTNEIQKLMIAAISLRSVQ